MKIPNTKIQESVMASFERDDHDEMQKFAETIRESWREQATAFNRSVLLMLSLVAVFALLTGPEQKQATLLGITLANTWLLQILMPLLVAYLYLDAVITSRRGDYYADIHYWVMRKLNPKLAETGLESFMGPRFLSVVEAGTIPKLWKVLPYGPGTEIALSLMGLFAMGAVPAAFLGFAYYWLVGRYEDKPLTWVSLGLSIILWACAFLLWFHYGKNKWESIWSWFHPKVRRFWRWLLAEKEG
jgi:hypothetical protein